MGEGTVVGEAQNSFPAEHGHRIAQKRDGGGGRDRGGQKRPPLHAPRPAAVGMSGGRASKYVCKRQHISESETSSLRKIAFFLSLPFPPTDMRTRTLEATGERRRGELEHVVVFTRVFKDPAMRELIKELCQ